MDYSINKKWYKKWWAIIIFIFLGIVSSLFILVSIFIIREARDFQGPNTADMSNLENQIIYFVNNQEKHKSPEGNHSLNFSTGTNTPKLTIVEFSSFSCPRSKSSFSKIRQLSLKYQDEVKLVFRHYPTDEDSFFLSHVSYCAGEQGAFWPMHDKLFQNQGNFYEENIYRFVKQIGLDTNLFSKCMEENKYEDEIKNDIIDGERLGVEGTPTWFFNGRKLSGDMPEEILEGIILKLISK